MPFQILGGAFGQWVGIRGLLQKPSSCVGLAFMKKNKRKHIAILESYYKNIYVFKLIREFAFWRDNLLKKKKIKKTPELKGSLID